MATIFQFSRYLEKGGDNQKTEITMLADCFIAKAEYVNDYKLLIVFEDGQKRVADFYTFMSKCKLPCVKKFLDIDLFKQFRIEDGTVCWGDNEMDFNPLDIYCGFFFIPEKITDICCCDGLITMNNQVFHNGKTKWTFFGNP